MKIKKINQSAGVVANVVDNLNSISTQDALSANQGKLLNENKVNKNGDTIDGDLSFTNRHYISLEAGDVFEDNTTSNAFKALQKARVTRDGTKKYVEFGCGAEGAAVLEAQDETKAIMGRLEVRQDGTIYNYKSDNKLMEEECVPISKEEFFESLNYNILEFYAYRCGNMVNIQRCVIESITYPTTETQVSIGTIKSKYAPFSSTTIRAMASAGGGANINCIFMLTNANKADMYWTPDLKGTTSNCYIFNIMYFMKGSR